MSLITTKKLKVNQSIDIEVKKGLYKGTFPSKIDEVNEEDIKVLAPYRNGEIVPLRVGTEVNIFFTGKDAAYKFNSEILDRIKDQVKLLVITPPEEIVRIQRRDYFRLDVKKDAKYRKLDEDLESEGDFIETQTVDLSGGGVRLVNESELEEGDFIELMIELPGIEEVVIIGEVKQEYNLPNGEAVGVEFKDISRQARDEIIGWLFDYQRELRKKGML
ncbi:MAG: flagellar brake protein [Bacillota bacterium]